MKITPSLNAGLQVSWTKVLAGIRPHAPCTLRELSARERDVPQQTLWAALCYLKTETLNPSIVWMCDGVCMGSVIRTNTVQLWLQLAPKMGLVASVTVSLSDAI